MKYIARPIVVDAVCITQAGERDPGGAMTLHLADGSVFTASPGMLSRIAPEEGDYLVTQEDGYRYLNPKHVFERKYAPAAAR